MAISDQTTVYSNISTDGVGGGQVRTGLVSVSGITLGGTTGVGATFSARSLIAPFVVQGSASSFTVVTWAAVAPGDAIQTFPLPGGAVSSLSSGLVAHSHCTQAGQIEFRLSNVSTLAQNQSTRTWVFVATRSGFTT